MPHPYASFIDAVAKPARYLGGEYQSVHKPKDSVDVRIALAFPDVYDIGMSHLGTKILYSLLNKHSRIACERAFAPWTDMEAELRRRKLPLVTLESAAPLSDFDVVGLSLQYEMTFTNVLTLLDLGGIPLRAHDRGDEHPLIIGGGPTATHPEPVAPFFDAFLIGDAEEVLPDLLLYYADLKKQRLPRQERLVRLAVRGGIYVPELYRTEVDIATGMEVVAEPIDPRVPARVDRVWIKDINQYPFPTDTPVPFAEAVFDRVSVEIARGCTEGCRFCQAGMIYRPVRERDPESIVKSVVEGVKKGGYDETSLTALSTADVSCITPLVKKVMTELKKDQVSLSVSSLRAYGLNEDLLDEISSVRATGLTFAPEAGTQRMRDVINKNVTEEDISASAEKIFSRGWSRMKLYFMIGLPTETDEDVRGIGETGGRLRRLGKKIRNDADVTVSVSSHVPKPHTPFQWCAMDSMEEIVRKQRLLRDVAKQERVVYKWHEAGVSFVEGIFSRGDRKLADLIETAWQMGARFDGWDEHFNLALWQAAIEKTGIDPVVYLQTRPVDARLPWDHIDVGLKEGFLAWEYRRAIKDRLSPPCGKPNKTLLHHTNIEDAESDTRKLVCYDCGIACDMTGMREERIVYLRKLDAHKKPEPIRLPVLQAAPAEATAATPETTNAAQPTPVAPPKKRKQQVAPVGFAQSAGIWVRLHFEKVGKAAYLSHLDTMRHLIRLFRRAEIELIYSKGFHPKPNLIFSPALALGISAVNDFCDAEMALTSYERESEAELLARIQAVCPEGLKILALRRMQPKEKSLPKVLAFADFAAYLPPGVAWPETLTAEPIVVRKSKDSTKQIRVADGIAGPPAVVNDSDLRTRMGWSDDGTVVRWRAKIAESGAVRPIEVLEGYLGQRPPEGTHYAREMLWSEQNGTVVSPFVFLASSEGGL